jgi:GTP diphosphokinase / guanosine-3',5'-bis(diphosphate) 3'-diphosphatase
VPNSHLNKELLSYLSKEQVDEINQAYLFSAKAHKKQTRSSGEDYISHPLAVATILAQMHMDSESIIAAILHDVLEDTKTSKKSLEKKFGTEITKLVDGVSKLTQISFESHAEAQAENFRKMIMAMVDDIRVILIKIADRLHNMRTLQYLPLKKRKRIAKETLEIYAPIANRLGMHLIRIELEEKSFAILYPVRYQILQTAIKKARGNRKEIMGIIESSLQESMENQNVTKFKLLGREKHLYSIYKKMRDKHLQFSEIMDIYAFRIVVKNVDCCYRTLGIIHNLYKPLPERFKDYIAIPKANGYQSLHTTLFGPYGVPIEIQIRTEEMDKMAENGIAAHWLYESEKGVVNKAQLRAREWIKGLLDIQRSAGNSLEFIENVKIDLFPDEVYVFSPKGEIMELPHGATPIDFAYAVHSDVGDSCISVKIDRRQAPLSARLRNGQTVEISTSPDAHPNPTWLNFIVTGKARGKIRHFLKHQKVKEAIALGKSLIEKTLIAQKTRLADIPQKVLQKVLKASNHEAIDDLFADIGLGNQPAQIVARRLTKRGIFQIAEKSNKDDKPEPLYIKGTKDMLINFAKCCHPIPGDHIGGILTTGHGIVVHYEGCKNLAELRHHPDKYIPLRWEDSIHSDFEVELNVVLVNKRGTLANLALAVARAESNINNVNIVKRDTHCHMVNLTITVRDRKQLARVMQSLRNLKSVIKITRIQNT